MAGTNKKALSGFLWNLSEKLLIQVITFVVGLILARKLGPETYGLVATVTVIISLITISTNLYTGTYLMRKKEVDSLDMNTSFYFVIFVHLLFYALLFLLSPLIANFYGKPELTNLLRVMGLNLLFSPFMGVKLVIIVRNYQYKKLFFASFIGTVVAGATGIVLAYNGFGPWALVAVHCLDGAIDTLILWFAVKWRPKLQFSFSRLKEMFRYGLPLWAFGIIDSLSTRLQQLIIGKKYSQSELAFYNRGESFPSIVESNSTSSLNDVLLRRVSEEQNNPDSIKTILGNITKICLCISFPLMIGLASVANLTILLLLGEEWLPSVIFMQIFCIAFAFKPLEVTSDVALKAVGKTKQFFIFGFIKKSLFILGVLAALPYGPKAIVISFLVASICAASVSVLANKICFKLPIRTQITNLIIPLVVSFVMWAFVTKIGSLTSNWSAIASLIIQVFSGAFLYLVSVILLDKTVLLYLKKGLSRLTKREQKEKQ